MPKIQVKTQTGMQGVYLVAAELTYREKIVSVTSRNAFGADLLVTDADCKRTWSIQVKTNRKPANYWLVGEHAGRVVSSTHIYVFVNLKGNQRPEFYVVPSEFVGSHIYEDTSKAGSKWYSFDRRDLTGTSKGWEIFDLPQEALLVGQ
jgi:hypothetical protein